MLLYDLESSLPLSLRETKVAWVVGTRCGIGLEQQRSDVWREPLEHLRPYQDARSGGSS